MTRDRPSRVSVIVAASAARGDVAAALGRIVEEAAELGRVVVVDGSTDRLAAVAARRFPEVEVLLRPADSLVPELWRAGLHATSEPFVAFTTTQMMPARGRLASMLGCLETSGAAAVGGPIEPAPGLGALDRAVYLLRYVRYMQPVSNGSPSPVHSPTRFSPQPSPSGRGCTNTLSPRERVPEGRVRVFSPEKERAPAGSSLDLPGDNSLYRRERLDGLNGLIEHGFWESEINRILRERGEALLFEKQAVVTFRGGVKPLEILRHRYRHARHYAAGRAQRFRSGERIARTALIPLVPPLMLARIGLALSSRRARTFPWFTALPWLCALIAAWTWGEVVGMWRGRPVSRPGGHGAQASGLVVSSQAVPIEG